MRVSFKFEEKLKENIDFSQYFEYIKIIFLLIIGIFIFFIYTNYITYKKSLDGEHILYVKIDGKTGAVLKIDNKYLRGQYSIKNSRNLEYGTYLVRFNIKKVTTKNGFSTLEGKILGYKNSKLNFIRRYVLNIFDELFITENNLYAFSKAAILGEKSDISKDMKDKFKYTGLAHLIVISGTHISLVVMGIVKMLDSINIGYRLKYILALISLTFYCMLVGMSPGIMRAYIMGALMILARILFEQEESKKSLLISLIVILILNPYAIFDISMQLSYAAVIAIILVYPPIEKACMKIIKKLIEEKKLFKLKSEVANNTLKLMFLSLIIQFVSLPLFLYYFEKLPLFSFMLNVIGVPIGTILIQALFGVTFLNIFQIKFFNTIFVYIIKFIYGAFEGFIYIGSRIPLLQLDVNGKVSIYFVAIYYILIILLIFGLKKYDIKNKSS